MLVAAEGAALGWRAGSGPWIDAGRDAALLPATVTEIRVVSAGGATTVSAAP
ncbi:hypothetical protein [Micromonospora sp. NPDC050200]|uniref:hypothetical protein n=1 Tax=Micromonospora sp. NPDC050200 TaxID=3155664 RepID=UPI0033FD76E1